MRDNIITVETIYDDCLPKAMRRSAARYTLSSYQRAFETLPPSNRINFAAESLPSQSLEAPTEKFLRRNYRMSTSKDDIVYRTR